MNKFYTKVSLNIIAVFFVMMVMSIVPEVLPNGWFSYYCPADTVHEADGWKHVGYATYHWTWRHYVWVFMGFALFIVQVVRIIEIIENRK